MNAHKQELKNKIRNKILGHIDSYKIRAGAWRKARIKTKADGTDFKQLTNASCENCHIKYGFLNTNNGYPRIETNFQIEGRYSYDDIPAYGSFDAKYPHVTQSGENVFNTPNTTAEINRRIQAQADKYEWYANGEREQLTKIDLAFDDFYDAVMNAYIKLIGVCGGDDTSVFYGCVEHVIKNEYEIQRVARMETEKQGGKG